MSETLRVWGFPLILSEDDRVSLLKHFGATNIKHLKRGSRSYALLAKFKNAADSEYVLKALHQYTILGKRLMVCYHDAGIPHESPQPHKDHTDTLSKSLEHEKYLKSIANYESKLNAISSKLGVNHTISPTLKYLYPPPSPSIIANIANALISVPKLYTQVLHLMNKMNLPTPFGEIWAISDMYKESLRLLDLLPAAVPIDVRVNDIQQKNAEEGSHHPTEDESESELESDQESKVFKNKLPVLKKRTLHSKHSINKRPKLSQLQQTFIVTSHRKEPTTNSNPSTNINPIISKKLEVIISTQDLSSTMQSSKATQNNLRIDLTTPKENSTEQEGNNPLLDMFGETIPIQLNKETLNKDAIDEVNGQADKENNSEGFGKLEAKVQKDPQSPNQVEWERQEKFITEDILNENRIKKSDWHMFPPFKNYSPGDPSSKLYIKNLAKATTMEDLRFIYGRYVFWQNDAEAESFVIRLLQEGRMRGQAFVSLPSAEAAAEAREHTNGYILNDKPMVVAFGREKT